MLEIDIAKIDSIGARIHRLIRLHGDVISDLAAEMGVSQSQLSRLLADKSKWSEDKVIWFAQRYQVSFMALYFGTEEENAKSVGEMDVLLAVDKMVGKMKHYPVEQQKTFVKLLLKNVNELIEKW